MYLYTLTHQSMEKLIQWIQRNGRKTTVDNRSEQIEPDLDEDAALVPEDDFVAVNDAPQYYVSIDPSGKLGW